MTRYAAILLFPIACAAAGAALDAGRSRVEAEFTQIGVPVTAPFTRIDGGIEFDPARPAAATARIEIETASFDIGDEAYNAEVRKTAWFDCAKYPKAVFVAAGLTASGPNRYQISGTLSLKGRDQMLRVPVRVEHAAGSTVFDGVVPISRKAFDIGDPSWADVVEDTVKVKFHIVVPASS